MALACVAAGLLAPGLGAAQAPPPLAVSAAALYAPATGQLLFGVNPNREVAIASATKLMTALITLEHVRHLSTTFAQNDWYPAAADSQIGLVPGERMSVHDLLLALMLPSADDAAEDLAVNVGHGSVGRFVGMMNARARELGLRHTHYSTPIGLDTPGNYSSAADLVTLAGYDLAHSKYFARIVALRGAVLRSGNYVRAVVNRNDLVGRVPWIDGVKTGHTGQAGYVLVASGHRSGMALISAVLGTGSAQERDSSTLAVLDYGFAEFRMWTPVRAGEVLARPGVRDRPGVHPAVIAAQTFTRALARQAQVRTRIELSRRLIGPLARHAVVGTAVVFDGRRPIARVPLLLARALPAAPGATIAARLTSWPLVLGPGAIVVALGLILTRATRRRRRTTRSGGELEAA
jgi:D-alanyl-D-alanine carboxypeptidase (penicillin-binding protein 5/6)